MLPRQEAEEEDSPKFSWGVKKGMNIHKDVQFYKSFTYDGIEYSLYDCVFMWSESLKMPYVGKLVRVWETRTQEKMVKVVWFFRPTEITHWLGDIKVLDNELLLASGEGKGLLNRNPVEAICGKCNVVCISTDRRNPQPTEEELRTADYVFYRTFDVGTYKISEEFVNSIAQIEVEHFFNKGKDWQRPLHHGRKRSVDMPDTLPPFGEQTAKMTVVNNRESTFPAGTSRNSTKFVAMDVGMSRTCQSSSSSTSGVEKELKKATISLGGQGRQANTSADGTVSRTKVKHSNCTSPTSLSDCLALKKRKLQGSLETGPSEQHKVMKSESRANTCMMDGTVSRTIEHSNCTSPGSLSDSRALKKRKLQGTLEARPSDQHKVMKSGSQVIEVTRRMKEDPKSWFKQLAWDERLSVAQREGSLVLLENLDPSYTSSEVEEIVWHTLNQNVSAKMMQHNTFSSPLNGQAFVIFKSSEAADTAISELRRRCLVIGDRRPVVARRPTLGEPVKTTSFPGHIAINKIKFQMQREEVRKAVSTSHYSQSNTIEHEMALEWRVVQEKSSLRWNALHEKQASEIELLRKKMRVHTSN